MAKDVIVVVQRDALPNDKESLDILLVSTTGAYPVGTYRDIASVEAVYGPNGLCPNAKVVRKATTLLNQGKTTLAETLVNKFKIVSFEPPSASPASAATFSITFAEGGAIQPAIPAKKNLMVKIGGDDKAIVELTTAAEINSTQQLAALFDKTSFTKGGKTYTAAVTGTRVVYTATVVGAADTIPETVIFYEDVLLSVVFPTTQTAKFVNGADVASSADNLIKAIKTFQNDVDNDWYFLMTDKDEDAYTSALAKFAEASEPSEVELGAGIEDHRKFYMGQTHNKNFACVTARAAIIYADTKCINEEPDASYTGNVAPFYPNSVTWKFKRPQDGNAPSSAGVKLITLPQLTEGERNQLLENHVNFLAEEYKRQYVKNGTCLNGEFIDVVLGGDWIAKRMRDLLYDILLANANINYDDAGFGLISTAVLQALAEAVDLNIIAVDTESKTGVFTVTIPKYADSTEEQRRGRTMPDITWEALLSGAIHQVKSKGVLRATL
ncbi:MAG: DUF3383 family protein [Bacteroides sp.]